MFDLSSSSNNSRFLRKEETQQGHVKSVSSREGRGKDPGRVGSPMAGGPGWGLTLLG